MPLSIFEFRFLKKADVDDKDTDHVVKIFRNKAPTGPKYLWVFKDDNAKTQVTFMKDEDTVIDAVRNMFYLLANDTEPFEYVQVFAPGFPSPLLNMRDVDTFRSDVTAMLRTVFASWAEEMTSSDSEKLVKIFLAGHVTNDIEEEDEEDEEDEDEYEEGEYTNYYTPPRPSRARECPGAPARDAWNDFLEDPECPDSHHHRIRRTVTETSNGPRVHLHFG